MAKTVFISYSKDDRDIAFEICGLLEERDVSCWIAPRDVPPGRIYSEVILDAIHEAVGIVLILSEHANRSIHVRNEVERAVSKGKAVFPVRIREVEPSRALELFVMSAQWVEAWHPPLPGKMDQLAAAIKQLASPIEQQPNGPTQQPPQRHKPYRTRLRPSQSAPASQARSDKTASVTIGKRGITILGVLFVLILVVMAWQRGQDGGAGDAIRPGEPPRIDRSTSDPTSTQPMAMQVPREAAQRQPAQPRTTPEPPPTPVWNADDLGWAVDGSEAVLTLPDGVEMEFVWCPPGTFMMGSPEDEESRQDDETQHEVTLTKGFWLGKYEVTQAQWQEVMGNNPSYYEGDGQRPVDTVSWDDCKQFIAKLNVSSEGPFRLPTEAEWEYACRAGSTTSYCFGDDEAELGEYAWYQANSGEQTHLVGQKTPNAWGLHDMHGNVWEWCQDWRGGFLSSTIVDPTGPNDWMGRGVPARIKRGGSWNYFATNCRAAYRGWDNPANGVGFNGFRVCCSVFPR